MQLPAAWSTASKCKLIAEKPRHLCLGFCSTRPALRARFRPRRCPRLPCRAGEVAPAQQATEGCWRFTHLTKETQTFGTPPAALTRVHLPYNVGEAFTPRRAKAGELSLPGFSVISFCKLPCRPGRRQPPPYRSLVSLSGRGTALPCPPRRCRRSRRGRRSIRAPARARWCGSVSS